MLLSRCYCLYSDLKRTYYCAECVLINIFFQAGCDEENGNGGDNIHLSCLANATMRLLLLLLLLLLYLLCLTSALAAE